MVHLRRIALVASALTNACAFPKMEVGPDLVEAAATAGASSGGTRSAEGGGSAPDPAGGTSFAGTTTTSPVVAQGGANSVAGASATGTGSGCTGNLETVLVAKGLCVAKTVMVSDPSGSASFGVDATEVTRGQYEAWLATNPALQAKSDLNCGANSTYAGAASCLSSSQVCKTSCNSHPMVCIDWCDAAAYCTAVEKRLCGKIGGGMNTYADLANEAASQWYRACSAAAANVYPYSNSYAGTLCNSSDYWSTTTTPTALPVGSLATCQSSVAGYAGIFDMSGNVMEWEDSCSSSGISSGCRLRGGSFDENAAALGCGYAFSYVRTATNSRVGFRCCTE